MRIGIIGSGNMARALGRRWLAAGHDVMVSSRDAHKGETLARSIGGSRSGSFNDAAAFGELVLLAVHWTGVLPVLPDLLIEPRTILVDCNNPVEYENWTLTIGFTDSFAEQIASAVPHARVVKAFNTIFRQMLEAETPAVHGIRTSCFIAGDDAESKATVAGLARDALCEPVDCGRLDVARLLEPAAALIIRLGWVQKLGPDMALNLMSSTAGSAKR